MRHFTDLKERDSARRVPRRTGRLAAYILKRLWTLKLEREDLADIDDDNGSGFVRVRPDRAHIKSSAGVYLGGDSDGSSPTFSAVELEARGEFFRRMAAGSWKMHGTDRKIAQAVAEGWSYRKIKAEFSTGQRRIDRIVYAIVKERNPPWDRRPETQAARRVKRVPKGNPNDGRSRRRKPLPSSSTPSE